MRSPVSGDGDTDVLSEASAIGSSAELSESLTRSSSPFEPARQVPLTVVVRIRPLTSSERSTGQNTVWSCNDDHIWQSSPAVNGRPLSPHHQQHYAVDQVFGPSSSLLQLHNKALRAQVFHPPLPTTTHTIRFLYVHAHVRMHPVLWPTACYPYSFELVLCTSSTSPSRNHLHIGHRWPAPFSGTTTRFFATDKLPQVRRRLFAG